MKNNGNNSTLSIFNEDFLFLKYNFLKIHEVHNEILMHQNNK
jgi:hypothetical protein